MEVLQAINSAIDYMEENLQGEINYDDVAKVACYSSYNFHRMFTFICGISPSEYVRRRRLTLAAFEFNTKKRKVIDVALKYGYDSPVSFSKAFKALHGVSPSEVVNGEVTLTAYPRMSLELRVKGDEKMDYRIEKKKALKAFGYEGIISEHSAPKHYKYPGLMWKVLMSDGRFDKLADDTNYKEYPGFQGMCRVHAILNYKETPEDTFSYMVGAFVGDNSKTDGYDVIEIPETTYAVFPSGKFNWDEIGTVVGNIMNRVDNEWLPTSSYKRAGGAEFEIYGGSEEVAEMEIWIPVEKK
jgi:AraC family transcriptional regulator